MFSSSVLDDLDAAELCCLGLSPPFVTPPRYLPQPKLGEFIASKCTLLPDSVRIALESTATRMSKYRGQWVFDVAMLSVAWASLLFCSVGCTPPNSEVAPSAAAFRRVQRGDPARRDADRWGGHETPHYRRSTPKTSSTFPSALTVRRVSPCAPGSSALPSAAFRGGKSSTRRSGPAEAPHRLRPV